MFHPHSDAKQLMLIVKASAAATVIVLSGVVSPAFCQTTTPAPKAPSPKGTPAQPASAIRIGVFDEAKLLQARSDFPTLSTQVLPQVVAKYKLTFVVTKQGLRWGGSKLPSVDVTTDILTLLQKLPPTPNALTSEQRDAAKRALGTLSDLEVALRVGNPGYDQYNERVVNTSIAFEASMRDVPDGALKTQLLATQQAFLDLRTAWDTALKTMSTGQDAIKAIYEPLVRAAVTLGNEELVAQTKKEMEDLLDQKRADAVKDLPAARAKPVRELEASQKLLATYSTQ